MDEFTRAYFEAALWSTNDESTPEGGVPLDESYTIEDFAPATRNQMINDARSFQRMHGELIEIDDSPEIRKYGRWELAGHDFWLTQNEHGAGFEDGQWPRSGDALAKAARAFGRIDLYVGDDGLIHGSGSLPGLREKRANARRYSVPKRPPHRHVAPLHARASHGIARGGGSQVRLPGRAEQPRRRAAPKRPKVDRRRYDFFRKNAGGAVGYSAQIAWDLAAAEQEAQARGWTVTWEDDPEGWDTLGDIDPSEVREVLWAALLNEGGEVIANLGGIADPDRDYARLVEAELALEALSEEGWTPSG